MRVLANMLGFPGFDYETIEELRVDAVPKDLASLLDNSPLTALSEVDMVACKGIRIEDLSVGIYGLDSLVRRSPALQHTADAQLDPLASAYQAVLQHSASAEVGQHV